MSGSGHTGPSFASLGAPGINAAALQSSLGTAKCAWRDAELDSAYSAYNAHSACSAYSAYILCQSSCKKICNHATLQYTTLPISSNELRLLSMDIYTLCLSLHIQYFSYVVDAPQHFHFNAWIKHDQTSSNPSDTLLHIMPFISIHYHLYSFIISSNSLINYGTMGQDIVWVCLCVVHLPCWRCIVREMFMHVCVCLYTCNQEVV